MMAWYVGVTMCLAGGVASQFIIVWLIDAHMKELHERIKKLEHDTHRE
jgi:hypothetical protein